MSGTDRARRDRQHEPDRDGKDSEELAPEDLRKVSGGAGPHREQKGSGKGRADGAADRDEERKPKGGGFIKPF